MARFTFAERLERLTQELWVSFPSKREIEEQRMKTEIEAREGYAPAEPRALREYVPHGAIVKYEYKLRRFRDRATGRFISRAQFEEIKRTIATFNRLQALREANPNLSREEAEYVISHYEMLKEVSQEEANDYIRATFGTP